MRHAAGLLLLLAVLGSCNLQGIEVRFQNSTTTFTIMTIRFANVVDTSTLSPSAVTAYSAVAPGQHTLLAQLQDGTWTNGVDFTVTAGHSYTITFSNGVAPGGITVSMSTDN
ncbi:MAG TPA: hypothetical protein VMV03_01635 [Spirochaetia bacterium]|nr:hypothetical protein [Spirochaetia bacterium]